MNCEEFNARIDAFSADYTSDWSDWLNIHQTAEPIVIAEYFGRYMRKWQACRPHIMRRLERDELHPSPYLEELILRTEIQLQIIQSVNLSDGQELTDIQKNAFREFWEVFKYLCFKNDNDEGLARIVGISKAMLFLTDGKVGPAFDAKVMQNFAKKYLNVRNIATPEIWMDTLGKVKKWIVDFEHVNNCHIDECVPNRYAELGIGRILDMAFGPT